MKKSLLTSALLAVTMLSTSAIAATYEYTPDAKKPENVQKFTLDFKAGQVSAEACLNSGPCQKGQASVDALTKKLTAAMAQYDKLLSNKDKLIADAKKQASSDKAQIINDEASKKKFVMVSAGDMNLAIDMEQVAKNDFSLVTAAMESNRTRYKDAIDLLKSGKAPDGFKTDQYQKIATVYHLTNIVIHSKK